MTVELFDMDELHLIAGLARLELKRFTDMNPLMPQLATGEYATRLLRIRHTAESRQEVLYQREMRAKHAKRDGLGTAPRRQPGKRRVGRPHGAKRGR